MIYNRQEAMRYMGAAAKDAGAEQLCDVVYLKSRNEVQARSFIRMFAIPYRVVLLEKNGMEFAGFIIYCGKEEKEELDSTMEWIARSHSEWELSL